jgi:hypothetical protein
MMRTGRKLRTQPTLLAKCAAIVALTLIHSHSEGQNIANIDNIKKRPAKPIELLHNLKIAFDKSLFLEPSFRTDMNLIEFFNGAAVRVIWDNPTSKTVDIVKFGDGTGGAFVHILEVGVSTKLVDTAGFQNPNGNLEVNVGIGGISEPDFYVSYVTDLFGQPTIVEESSMPGPKVPKTHPLGDKQFLFRRDSPGERKEIAFTTRGDGTVFFILLKDGVK